jgi:hypothetical protein
LSKEIKTAEELHELLHEAIRPFSLGRTPNPQWVKIVPADPQIAGANWRVAHSGAPGDFSDAIEHVMPGLQERYDLKQ